MDEADILDAKKFTLKSSLSKEVIKELDEHYEVDNSESD